MADSIKSYSKKTSSFRQYVTTYVVSFLSFALLCSIITTSYFFIEHNKQLNTTAILQFAKIAASISVTYINEGDHKTLTKKLALLDDVANINYVHVYKSDPKTNALTFFTSYNNNDNFPTIPNQIDKKDRLSAPQATTNGIEFIYPVKDEDQLYGYIYIQMNDNKLQSIINTIILIMTAIVILFIILGIMISFKISNKVSDTLSPLLSTIQQTARDKDFTLISPPSYFKEVDLLVRNTNILLNRTHKHLEKLSELDGKNKQITKDLEAKVGKRTDALKESNQELLSTLEKLHQFQGQLVESEKMASLGDMVAGLAHEVNTPIGLGITASTLLSDRLKAIRIAFDDKTLKSSELKKFIYDSDENISLIYRNLKRAADLISSFKKVAVDQSTEDIRSFNVKELLNEVIITLGPKISNTPYKIEILCPDDLTVNSKPGPINQILINLIINSIIHGFENKDSGTITISIMSLSHQLHIQFEDDGRGIDKSVINKIFEPFTTTKRGKGGSGLGLHLVYNLVTQALGGNISLDKSTIGVNFNIYLPITINKQTKNSLYNSKA